MPDIPNKHRQNPPEVISEIVAFRYTDEAQVMLVGEAELVIEVFGDKTETGTNLYSVRVDIISAYDPEGADIYPSVMHNPDLRQALEKTALDHYFHPPRVPVGLPKKTAEW